MGKHIVFIGAGAVGGYVGGHLTRAGEDVTLVDPWPEHVQAMRSRGLHLGGSQGEHVVKVNAINVCDVQGFMRKPVDVAVICTKSYDTEWAAMMIRPYLAPRGYVVSMQNGINEERIARAVGWGRTVGTTVSTISVNAYEPGRIKRYQEPGSSTRHNVFRVGEVHGLITERVTELARIFNAVDRAAVTDNLWGERWTKLSANTITHGLLGSTGLDNTHVYVRRDRIHLLGVKLGGEAVAVGRALGFRIGTILGISPDDWYEAGINRDARALRRVQDGLTAWMATLIEPSHSSVGRDVMRGRLSEIDYTNGLVADKGVEADVPAPTHAAVTALVRRIDRGELKPDPSNVDGIPV
ncbi:MAG: ketopantoate reductase family protein [Burkholderiales bacterium]|nr:ketopantoate reductase family protein [Burkholderiales bacterium]